MGMEIDMKKIGSSRTEKENNIKLDIIALLDDIDNGKYSNIQINYYFNEKKYSYKEKMFITNIINITLKNLIYIDYMLSKVTQNIHKRKIRHLLRISAAQLFFTEADAAGILYEAGELSRKINSHQVSFVNAVLHSLIKNKKYIEDDIPSDKKEGIIYSYPQWFVNKIKNEYPKDYLEIMKSYKNRSYISVRYDKEVLNKNKFNKILSDINSEIIFSVDEVYYLSNGNILNTEEFKKGSIVIQDASSYLAVKNLNVKKGDKVLDACSAPGGKALAILQMSDPELLLATDIHEHKIGILENLRKKYNYDNFKIKLNDATEIEKLDMKFDRILLDVPCSGLGVLRKKPEKIYSLSTVQIKELKKLQQRIFASAYNSLKDGGYIIYSTCTFTRNENTNNVMTFLEKYDRLEIQEVEIPDNIHIERDSYGGVYITHKNKYLDGFYIAKFKKRKL